MARCLCTARVDGEHSDVPDVLRALRRAEDKPLPDSWSVRGNQHAAVPLLCTVPWNRGFHLCCVVVIPILPPPRRLCFRRRMSVCLLGTLRKNCGMILHEIFREGWQWAEERLIKLRFLPLFCLQIDFSSISYWTFVGNECMAMPQYSCHPT